MYVYYVKQSAIIESPMNCSTSSVLTYHDLESCGEYNHGRMKMNNTHVNIAVQPPPPFPFFSFTSLNHFFPLSAFYTPCQWRNDRILQLQTNRQSFVFSEQHRFLTTWETTWCKWAALWCRDYQWECRQSTKKLSSQQEANSEDWETSRDFISVSTKALESEWGKCLAFGKNAWPDHSIPDISLFPDGGGRKWWKRRRMRNLFGCLFFPNDSNIRTAIRNSG